MLKKITEWIIPLSCILLQYQAIVSTYGILALVFLAILYGIQNRYIFIDKNLLMLTVAITVQQFISGEVFKIPFETTIKSVVTVFLIVLATSLGNVNIDRDRVILNLKKIGIICAIAVYIQSFMYIVLKIPVKSIMILPQDETVLHYWTTSNVRACAFFTEPQTYCSYMFPLLIICLIREEYKISAFLTISFLFTGSSLGILMAAIVWCIVFFKSKIETNKKIGFVLAVLIGVVAFLSLDVFSSAREKISTIYTDFSLYTAGLMTNSHSYTNYLRLVKGWITLIELPVIAKLLGVGINGLIPFMSSTGMVFSWSKQWFGNSVMVGYFTSAAGVFIECGIVVGIFYYVYILNGIRGNTKLAKYILIFMLLQSFTTQMFFNGIFTFYIVMYYLFTERKYQIELTFGR